MKKAIYAGSFDPPTNGHLWMVKQASNLFDEVIVAVAHNPNKKYQFNIDTRLSTMKESVKGIPNCNVIPVGNEYIVDVAKRLGAEWLVRGLRSTTDFEAEKTMRHLNEAIAGGPIQTLFLMAPKQVDEISSSGVKSLVGPLGWRKHVAKFVPKASLEKLEEAYFITHYKDACYRLAIEDQVTDIIKAYREPNRHYHTLAHIIDCLDLLESINPIPIYFKDVFAALLYHDLVYDVNRLDNEERSADMAFDVFKITGTDWRTFDSSKELSNKIKNLVLSTKHDAVPKDPAAKLLVDIDLSILAAEPERYQEYTEQIRKEYAHVPELLFKKGRYHVMNEFKKRQQIFSSGLLPPDFEGRARRNVEKECADLTLWILINEPEPEVVAKVPIRG